MLLFHRRLTQGDLFLKVESLDSIVAKCVHVLCCLRSVLHFSSCFWYRPPPPKLATCAGEPRISTSSVHLGFLDQRDVGDVSDATLTLRDGGGLSVGFGSVALLSVGGIRPFGS